MAEAGRDTPAAGGYVVLREVEDGHWYLVGDVDRKPGCSGGKSTRWPSRSSTVTTARGTPGIDCPGLTRPGG